jgi:hypothetical protein
VGGGELVVAGRDPAPVLEAAEHALNGVASAVENRAEARLPAPVSLGRDVWGRTLCFDLLAHGIGVVSAVGDDQALGRQIAQQRFACAAIGGLSGRQQERSRAAEVIRQRVDLGGASPAADAERLGALPPLPPVAQRCALMCVLSSSNAAGGPPAAARVWNSSPQIPFAAQRTNRL